MDVFVKNTLREDASLTPPCPSFCPDRLDDLVGFCVPTRDLQSLTGSQSFNVL